MMKPKLIPLVLALSLVGVVLTSPASAQTNLNNRTVLTFSQPVEVPGKVLPAGTYTFELHDSMANRHIVQIFDEGGTKLLALVLAVPNRRATPTEDTVVTFNEVPAGQPQAVRTWFYPGQVLGHEMVYSRTRAQALSASSNTAVPAVDDSFYADAKVDAMKTAEITPVTVDRTEPVPPVVQTQAAEPVRVDPRPVEPAPAATPAPRTELPRTAGALPLIALLGLGSIGVGFALRRFSSRRARQTGRA
jgi:hypothetical protein